MRVLRIKKRKLNIYTIFWILLYLTPIFDSINGIMINKKNISGIGSLFHFVITICAIIIYLKNLRNSRYFKGFCWGILSILIGTSITLFLGQQITTIAFERVLKIVTTAILILTFKELIHDNKVSKDQVMQMVLYQCTMVLMITFIADITGLCNYAYRDNRGRIGFYAGSNEPTNIFIIINALLLWVIHNKPRIKYFVLFGLGEICIVLTESKSGMVNSIILALLLLYSLLFEAQTRKQKRKKHSYILLIVPFVIIALGFAYRKSIDSFRIRQSYISSALGQSGKMNYLSSGRITRFDTLLVQPIDKLVSSGWLGTIVSLLQLIFGLGMSGDYGSTFEMDYLDMFYLGGFIWLALSIALSYSLIKSAWKNYRAWSIRISFLLIFVVSFFVGHVWNGGNSGLYFAFMCAILSEENLRTGIKP